MNRAILGGVFAVLLAVGPGAAAPEKPSLDPTKLPGKWEPKEQTGTVRTSLEFTKDGKTKAVGELAGQPIEMDGTYTLAGEKLTITLTFGGNKTPNRYTVLRLEGDRMEMADAKGVRQAFRRVKAEK